MRNAAIYSESSEGDRVSENDASGGPWPLPLWLH